MWLVFLIIEIFSALVQVCVLLGTQISDFILNFSQLYHAFFLYNVNNQDCVVVLSIQLTTVSVCKIMDGAKIWLHLALLRLLNCSTVIKAAGELLAYNYCF